LTLAAQIFLNLNVRLTKIIWTKLKKRAQPFFLPFSRHCIPQRHPLQKPFHTQILVDGFPVDPLAVAQNHKIFPLILRCLRQTGKPCQRHGKGASVFQVDDQLFNRDFDLLGQWAAVSLYHHIFQQKQFLDGRFPMVIHQIDRIPDGSGKNSHCSNNNPLHYNSSNSSIFLKAIRFTSTIPSEITVTSTRAAIL